MHTDKLVAGWSQGMLPQGILQGGEALKGSCCARRTHAIGWTDSSDTPALANTARGWLEEEGDKEVA